ncbi:KH domain-containing, RNA-binding, signal transduction-associated protein 3 [Homalodisca vitripennis]|nr:KH domain-containing, RNA-binding, signal transduction-associated protein 3 [Homalodisca vitripennis]
MYWTLNTVVFEQVVVSKARRRPQSYSTQLVMCSLFLASLIPTVYKVLLSFLLVEQVKANAFETVGEDTDVLLYSREEEFRQALDPKYAHLSDDLHVEIAALAPPAEAHARIAYALAEIRKYLVPDSNDEIRQEQMREIQAYSGPPPVERGGAAVRGRGRVPPPPPPGPRGGPPLGMRMAAPRPAPPLLPRPLPAKTKVLSILDRARQAMEESYGGYDDMGPEMGPTSGFYDSPSPGFNSGPGYGGDYNGGTAGDYYDTANYSGEFFHASSAVVHVSCIQHVPLPTLVIIPNQIMVFRTKKTIGKHGNLKLKHGSSDTSFERDHLVELNAANRISKGLSNQIWRVVLGTHCEVHYALPFLTGSSYSDAVGGVSLY